MNQEELQERLASSRWETRQAIAQREQLRQELEDVRRAWQRQTAEMKLTEIEVHRHVSELREALERVQQLQPRALAYIRAYGFKWEGKDAIGMEPGNWQHLAFSLYTDLCEADSIARGVLEIPPEVSSA